jgi:hypothetical protein
LEYLCTWTKVSTLIFVRSNYLAFRDTKRVRACCDHFDHLVRYTRITARASPDKLAGLRARMA